MLQRLKMKVRTLKQNSYALYIVYKDKRLPWWKRYFLAFIIGYLFSPIDLIPDFIPVIGLIDDLVIIPAGIYIALKLIPPDILEDAKKQAEKEKNKNIPIGYKTSILIVFIWIIGIFLLLYWILTLVNIQFTL